MKQMDIRRLKTAEIKFMKYTTGYTKQQKKLRHFRIIQHRSN